MNHPHSKSTGRSKIVEVGRLEQPIWMMFRGLPLAEQTYHGYNISGLYPSSFRVRGPGDKDRLLAEGRGKVEAYRRQGHDCTYAELKPTGRIELPNSSVSELYLYMVTSIPGLQLPFLNTLLDECARLLRPSGRLVLYNGQTMSMDGDVHVDYRTGAISFKVSWRSGVQPEDREHPASVKLNAAFGPMSPDHYRGFLEERGHSFSSVTPGHTLSILERTG
jgi:hypothetical protein